MQQHWELISDRRPWGITDILDILLENRGMESTHLRHALADLAQYLEMKGLDEAARLMAEHIGRGSSIALVADYDCDGITSMAQAALFLREIGYSNFVTFMPLRDEGYGMPVRAVEDNPDASLFVILDCGTRDVEAVAAARRRGADCIVIDHHEVPEDGRAPATVLVNPKQSGCPSPFKEFCSSGLTLLFLTRLRRCLGDGRPRPRLGGKYLELAALGTIADLVPLVRGNRILTRHGLASVNAGGSLPFRQLIEAAGLSNKALTAGHFGYQLGPRINAAGRLADPRLAYDLFMCGDPHQANQLARELNRLNTERRRLERAIMDQVRHRLTGPPGGRRTLVMGDPGWPVGLVGIVASRVQQEIQFGPVAILSIDLQTGIARGSARSVPGVDIHHALSQCGDLLIKWGGHRMAAGLSLNVDSMEAFAARLEEIASSMSPEIFQPRGRVDLQLEPRWVTRELVEALEQLEPHGVGNSTPTFLLRDVRIQVAERFGRDRNHLRVNLADGLQGIVWRGTERPDLPEWQNGGRKDVIFKMAWDDYRKIPLCDIRDVGGMNA
jgi:single-stranded-DNA-specific exonuclease